MATYYRYKRPITNSGAITTESMSVETWLADSTMKHMPCLAVQDTDGNFYDFIEFVSEISVIHEDIDGDKAGRSKKGDAKMVREFLNNKHTLDVKMINHLPSAMVARVRQLIMSKNGRTSFYAYHQHPCGDGITKRELYVSRINFGAQRYDRQTKGCYYDGMTFNMIEM